MENIISPLTLSDKVKKTATFQVSEICRKYADYGLDVTLYFKNLEVVDLFECQETGYRFYHPFRVVGDGAFYENLSRSKTGYYSNRWEHKIALQSIDKTDVVLEVGSGFGAFLKLLQAQQIKSKGLELNPHAVHTCVNEGLNVQEKVVQEEAVEHPTEYDVVCNFQVLEHITDVHGFIKASVDLLKPGGKLIIGVPNNNPYLFINDKYHTLNLPPHHAGLWNKRSLRNLQSLFKLKIELMEVEPLDVTYAYFINHQINTTKNPFVRKGLKALHWALPKVLKRTCCAFIDGRNVLVVYRKL